MVTESKTLVDLLDYMFDNGIEPWNNQTNQKTVNDYLSSNRCLPLQIVSNRISDEQIKRYRKEGALSVSTKREPFYKLIAQKFDENYEDIDFNILYGC